MKHKIFTKKIKSLATALSVIFWQRLYLAGIIFILISLALAVFLFLQFYFPKEVKLTAAPKLFEVRQDLLDNFVSEISKKSQNFQAAQTKIYPELFRGQR